MKVILTRGRTVASVAIRCRLTLARGKTEHWSHALVVMGDGSVIDSTFQKGGVRRRSAEEALRHASEMLVLDIKLPDEAAAEAWLVSQLGKPYDWRACWGFLVGSRDWTDDYAWFCFELVAAALAAGGLDADADASRVTGNDLLAIATRKEPA